MGYYLIAFVFVVKLCTSILGSSSPPIVNPNILVQAKSLGECQSCKLFVESFIKGLERTARGNYEGGDTAWEEEKLKKSYKRSEMRLIDIQDSLCKEEDKYAVQCHNIAEKAEEFIEEWWSKDPDVYIDLFDYICIESLKFCCPKHHYGKDCVPCSTDNDTLCSGNGKCRGDGTRKGNGTCLCDSGYTGENCDTCSSGYYVSYRDEMKIVCSPCHRSCLDCRQGSPKDCVACRSGYMFDPDVGCTDINECDDVNKCKQDQFCMNGQGSYACFACDKSCDRCHGDGPDSCRKCATGFTMKGEFCIQDREDDDRTAQLTTTSNRVNEEF